MPDEIAEQMNEEYAEEVQKEKELEEAARAAKIRQDAIARELAAAGKKGKKGKKKGKKWTFTEIRIELLL